MYPFFFFFFLHLANRIEFDSFIFVSRIDRDFPLRSFSFDGHDPRTREAERWISHARGKKNETTRRRPTGAASFYKIENRSVDTHRARTHRGKGKARRRKKTRLGWSRWMNWLRSNEEGEEEEERGNTCNRALKYGHLPMAPGLITSVFSEAGPGTVMY